MGIRGLNRFLRNKCPNSINFINMSELKDKRIAIDISIYLYKYEAENMLIENIYQMIAIFNHYKIIPIFIFDGKPPPEKKSLLLKRREDKEIAKKEYDLLNNLLTQPLSQEDKQEIISNMDQLKKQFVCINKQKIEKVKLLMQANGVTYYDAPGEADELCASLVINNKVWACMSEDTDLFVYGCHKVLRYFSIMSHTIVLYDMTNILKELDMSQQLFKEICVLSGTDYNYNINCNHEISLKDTIKYFNKYKTDQKSDISFYDWLTNNTNYIPDIEMLNKINEMFEVKNKLERFKQIKIINGPIRKDIIKLIMKDEGFIFCN